MSILLYSKEDHTIFKNFFLNFCIVFFSEFLYFFQYMFYIERFVFLHSTKGNRSKIWTISFNNDIIKRNLFCYLLYILCTWKSCNSSKTKLTLMIAGKSWEVDARNIQRPIPGQAKIDSIKMVPTSKFAQDKPITVTTGTNALGSA